MKRPKQYPTKNHGRIFNYPVDWEYYSDMLNKYIDELEHRIITINNNEDVIKLKQEITSK